MAKKLLTLNYKLSNNNNKTRKIRILSQPRSVGMAKSKIPLQRLLCTPKDFRYSLVEKMHKHQCILFDWGDTIMRDFPDFDGPMVTWPKVEVLPGVEHTLSQLGHTHTICLATNAAASEEDDIWKALERAAIHRLFDKVFCYRKVGHQKPSEAFFEYIFQDLQIPAEHIIMVGDSFENDVLGANRSGIFGIWFNERTPETKTGEMYTTIHDICELPKCVKPNVENVKRKT